MAAILTIYSPELIEQIARGNCIVCFGLHDSPDVLKSQRKELVQCVVVEGLQAWVLAWASGSTSTGRRRVKGCINEHKA